MNRAENKLIFFRHWRPLGGDGWENPPIKKATGVAGDSGASLGLVPFLCSCRFVYIVHIVSHVSFVEVFVLEVCILTVDIFH